MNPYIEKIRSLGTPRSKQKVRQSVERTDRGSVIRTEHSDGRVDVAVRPHTMQYEARSHKTGRKAGQVAEIARKENA